MAVVPLRFTPPAEPGWDTLHIFESPTQNGTYTEIDQTPSGTPNYIDRFTTDQATQADYWFAIQWSDPEGATTELSAGVQGGTETLVGILVQRILLRDSTINENVAAQEAEAAISAYFGVDDPATIDPATVNPKILEGLTLLALAWGYTIISTTQSNVQKFTAGLVSLDQGSSSTTRTSASVDQLLKLANSLLGRNYSAIAALKEIPVAGRFTQLVSTVDLSRTMIEI